MSEPFYVSKVTVAKLGSLHRRATLPDGAHSDYGVHGATRSYYKIESAESERALPVDHIVAAAGG
jgi:hypothetical protein